MSASPPSSSAGGLEAWCAPGRGFSQLPPYSRQAAVRPSLCCGYPLRTARTAARSPTPLMDLDQGVRGGAGGCPEGSGDSSSDQLKGITGVQKKSIRVATPSPNTVRKIVVYAGDNGIGNILTLIRSIPTRRKEAGGPGPAKPPATTATMVPSRRNRKAWRDGS